MTKIFAHRGSKGTHPENTLVAFEEAVRVGSDGIELDVHLSKDGELVVIHDETIDRTTNGSGSVHALTLSELKQFSAGSWFNSTFLQQTIPTLEEVLRLLIKLDFQGILNIELKTDVIEYQGIVKKCLDLQEQLVLPFSIVYSSFNPRSLLEVKQLRPKQEVAFLFESVEMASTEFGDLEIDAWHPDRRLLDWALSHNVQHFPLRVWTVNQTDQIHQCLDLKVAAIFTDFPEKALIIRDSEGSV